MARIATVSSGIEDLLTAGPPTAALAGLLCLAGLCLQLLARRKLLGTTLLAPWVWSVVALLAIAGAEIAVGMVDSLPPNWRMGLRYSAAMATFTPTMALLGAKRPQDRAWQFIVLSLWAILALPSLEWLLFGEIQELHPARLAFLLILVGVGAFNGIATRRWLSNLLYAAGQGALIAPFLSSTIAALPIALAPVLGLALMVASLALPMRVRAADANAAGLDRVWLDFRDAYGLVWSLRVAERMNTSAAMYDWPVQLGWRGFRDRESGSGGVVVPAAAAESLRALLRRFVSADWIDARINAALPTCENNVSDPFLSRGAAKLR
jgi:hypothetical protein